MSKGTQRSEPGCSVHSQAGQQLQSMPSGGRVWPRVQSPHSETHRACLERGHTQMSNGRKRGETGWPQTSVLLLTVALLQQPPVSNILKQSIFLRRA